MEAFDTALVAVQPATVERVDSIDADLDRRDPDSDSAPRIAITSWAAFTPFGPTEAAWDDLLAGRFITDHARSGKAVPMDRTVYLATSVINQLIGGDIGFGRDAGLVVGTSKGPVESWLAGAGGPQDRFESWPAARRSRRLQPEGLASIAAQCTNWLRGPRLTVSAACASGLLALVRGIMMIQAGAAEEVLVVAVEASLHPLFLASFQRLGVLAKPGVGCRPFDRGREGFLMSEAAAAVVLRAAPGGRFPARTGRLHKQHVSYCRGARIFVDRFAMGGDATHLTGGDPDARTLRYLLDRVIDGRPVDLVHAHGTGTPLNDAAELAAIESVVAPIGHAAPPAVYSHKGALGHSLGAAGLLSVVLNCQAHATGVVPPNVQTRDPLPTRRVTLSRHVEHRPVRRSIAVAAGFGGAMAAVSLVGGR